MTISMRFIICAWMLAVADALSVNAKVALEVFYDDCDKYDSDDLGIEVCGDDGYTYRNPLHLSCLNYRKNKSPAVRIISFGSCPGATDQSGCPWSPFYEPVCGTDGIVYVNEERLMCVANQTGKEILVRNKGECKEEDPCCKDEGKSTAPKVCASNGITYASARVVRCLAKHKAEIDIRHEGGCSVDEVSEVYPSRDLVCSLSRHHYEYNPVCGANNVSYVNPFIFLCYSPLTEAVFSGGLCQSPAHVACRRAIKLDRTYEECRKEVILPEVCGSDGLTYRSKDHLICAARNNTFLTILHEDKCTREDSPCVRARKANGHTVCGSDGVTYSNALSLFCFARSRDRTLKYVHSGPCVRRRNRPFNILSISTEVL